MAKKPQATGYNQLVPEGGLFCNSATPKMRLGTLVTDLYGNEYRYVKAAEAIAVGELVTPTAWAAWDTSTLVNGAVTAGAAYIDVDGSASTWTANQYAGYYIRQGTAMAPAAGLGRLHRIKSHAAVGTAGDGVRIYLDDSTPALEAFANNAVLNIWNPFVVELTDAALEPIRGVGIGTITANYYGFVQVGGFTDVLCDGSNGAAVVQYEPITPYGTDPGQGQGVDASTPAEADFNEYLSPLIAMVACAVDAAYVPAMFNRRV